MRGYIYGYVRVSTQHRELSQQLNLWEKMTRDKASRLVLNRKSL